MLTKLFQDSLWLRSALSSIKRLTVDATGSLRISGPVTVTGTLTTVTTVSTITTGNIGIGDSGKTATMISTSQNNFQSGGRNLFRKT